jgi:acyl-CoA dehydrogenase
MTADAKSLNAHVATSALTFGLIAPDTTGQNFYRNDPALTDLLRIHLPDTLFKPHRAAPRSARCAGGRSSR